MRLRRGSNHESLGWFALKKSRNACKKREGERENLEKQRTKSIIFVELKQYHIFFVNFCCPSPHGEGGLKSQIGKRVYTSLGPSPHGEGGLKFSNAVDCIINQGRPSPHGEGGLKSRAGVSRHPVPPSLPTRGGWIEMTSSAT